MISNIPIWDIKATKRNTCIASNQGGALRGGVIMKRCLIALMTMLCVVLCGCATNESKADNLFDEGSYQEALEIYESLESSDEINSKESDCRYWLFSELLGEVLQSFC